MIAQKVTKDFLKGLKCFSYNEKNSVLENRQRFNEGHYIFIKEIVDVMSELKKENLTIYVSDKNDLIIKKGKR